VLIYAWNPLPVWDFAGNGHIDAVAIGLLAAALLARVRHRDRWAGAALGLAIATKFLPAVVAPVLWRRRAGWWTALAAVLTIAALYALYSSAGTHLLGFLAGYGSEEGYDSGEGFWLLAGIARVMPLPGWTVVTYKIAWVVILAAFAAWFAFVQRPDDPVEICAAAGTMMAPAVLWMATAPILLYLDTFGDRFVWPSVVFAPAIALAINSLRPSSTEEPLEEIP
jgi:hypothetical protein